MKETEERNGWQGLQGGKGLRGMETSISNKEASKDEWPGEAEDE